MSHTIDPDIYYDRQGNPISYEQWGELYADLGYKRIARREEGDILVSTVWLGMDHGFGVGNPLIFETMVFGGDHDGDCERYTTEATALEGHARIVAEVFG